MLDFVFFTGDNEMPVNVSVTCDDDVYDFLQGMKEKSGSSMSQQANRLMRYGVQYNNLSAQVSELEGKLDKVMNFMQIFAENIGYQEQVEETIKMIEE